MLYGVGSTVITTNGLDASSLRGEQALFPQCLATFELSTDTTFAEAMCQKDGIMQTVAGAISGETFTLSLTYQFNDWINLQLLFGELASTESGVDLPVAKAAEVPTGLVITDTDIDAGSAASVIVTNVTDGVLMEVVGVAPAAINEVQVDGTTGELTFFTGMAGKTVEYVVDVTYTSIEAIGVASDVDLLTNLSFTGLIASTPDGTDGYQIIVDKLERQTTPTITLAGDVAEITIEYRCLALPGKRKPFRLYRLSTATV